MYADKQLVKRIISYITSARGSSRNNKHYFLWAKHLGQQRTSQLCVLIRSKAWCSNEAVSWAGQLNVEGSDDLCWSYSPCFNPWREDFLRTWYRQFLSAMLRASEGGARPHWILESLTKTVFFLVSRGRKQILPLYPTLQKNFGKILNSAPPGKNPSDHGWNTARISGHRIPPTIYTSVFQPFPAAESSANVCVAHGTLCSDPSICIAATALSCDCEFPPRQLRPVSVEPRLKTTDVHRTCLQLSNKTAASDNFNTVNDLGRFSVQTCFSCSSGSTAFTSSRSSYLKVLLVTR